MLNCHYWPLDVSSKVDITIIDHLDVSSNVKLSILTTRCQEHFEIAIPDH